MMTDLSFAYEKNVPTLLGTMAKVSAEIHNYELEPGLMHLVELRASQMNFCAFCVKMHIADARKDGETDARLDRLIVWRFVDDFSDAEKAALAWTEALTTLDQGADLASIRADLKSHFNPKQIGALTMLIAQINLWNRVQRSVY